MSALCTGIRVQTKKSTNLNQKIKKISVFLAKKKRICESNILISKYFFHAVVVQYPPRMKLHGLWFDTGL